MSVPSPRTWIDKWQTRREAGTQSQGSRGTRWPGRRPRNRRSQPAMPFVLRPPIRKARFSVTVAAAFLALIAFPNAASAAACKDTPTSTIFAAYGDFAQYKLFPNGDFDFGAPGWNLDNAVVDSNFSPKHSDAP